ncbi:PEP-CTERM sorting domain-containing protein [Aquincola sp. S2]|uniref:PEP-CTERM sorting domain-containing protein n=1 Tax=Pseudaquabacterium terrae TaxID=2732868 RepID=A0ABX2ESX7_9BURK|nr:PEP-CTERM sorting domain-containing protein [Aquabacterium terrae]NRF71708.1 PEP-CTERM sorting domain-containing protein [Aquabacterium terrae]
MRKRFQFALGAALLAASQLAAAGIAKVGVSNLALSVNGGEGWYWLPHDQNWLQPTSSTAAALENPSLADSASGWHGAPYDATVIDASSFAKANIGAATGGNLLDGVAASAETAADAGHTGWAFAQVFDGYIMVGGNATITLSTTLTELFADGDIAQANAYIELCSTDFTTDICEPLNYAEAFVDATSGPYAGPMTLSASWTNPGATGWARMRIGLAASAETDAPNTVPEPGSFAMLLTGLGMVGLMRRHRGR